MFTWIITSHRLSHYPLDVVRYWVAVCVGCQELVLLRLPERDHVLPESPGPGVPAQALGLVLCGPSRAADGDLKAIITEHGPRAGTNVIYILRLAQNRFNGITYILSYIIIFHIFT